MEIAQAVQKRRVDPARHFAFAGAPSEHFGVRHLHQSFELGEFILVETVDGYVREASHDEVHLAHATVPGAKQKFAPPAVQAVARTCRSGHNRSTPKARTSPGSL